MFFAKSFYVIYIEYSKAFNVFGERFPMQFNYITKILVTTIIVWLLIKFETNA